MKSYWENNLSLKNLFSCDVDEHSMKTLRDNLRSGLNSPNRVIIQTLVEDLLEFVMVTDPNLVSMPLSYKKEYMTLLNQINSHVEKLISETTKDKASEHVVGYAKRAIENQLSWIQNDKPNSPALSWYHEPENKLQAFINISGTTVNKLS